MSATGHEQEWAETHGVRIRHWATPHRLLGEHGHVAGVEFMRTQADAAGRATPTGETYTLPADTVLKAVGQVFVADPLRCDGTLALAIDDGRIAVDAERRTSIANVFAGGDCVAGEDLTVVAVQDGKLAAEAMHRQLIGGKDRQHG
jgi:dihydropyrimidine dehydrogenase (NAD+) subunit PreT